MSHDLRTLLAGAADDLVPEPHPLESHLDGVRRLVRRRQAVRRVQAGAGVAVGIVAIGSTAVLLAPDPGPGPAGSVDVCGEFFGDLLPPAGDVDGVAVVQASDGMAVSVRTQLENLGGGELTTAGDVRYLVSLHGTGEVVGYGVATPSGPTTILPGTSGDVITTATLVSCGFAGSAAGDPLPDGSYDLTLTGTAIAADGAEVGWSAGTADELRVENGQVSEGTVAPDPTADAAFEPVCGEQIPAVAENPMWATIAGPAASFVPADPDTPYDGGMPLDVTLGTTSDQPLSGELSPEVVVVLTRLDGTVVTWWRASEHDRPLDLGPAIELPAEGSQVFEGFGWFPVVDACSGGAPIADGDYRMFAWLSATVRTEGSDAVERYPVLSAPLDVTVGGGVMTQL